MGCILSKEKKPAEANVVGTELIRMAPPTRRPGFQADTTPLRARVISLPVVSTYPPVYEHAGAGIHGVARPSTSSGIPLIPLIPRIDITHDVIVEQDEAPVTNPGTTADQVGGDDANKATTTTTVEGGNKVATGPAQDLI
ncbi:hypothetical protein N0V84_005694 [Fusarium piperis]|uniref:Uncharacterized protein n=1 Tax=Fusarium piperis TaxID=1435070 RepID=A0A9W9BP97_9HYPO|nr:hypothetical protein N0V84_005694 [Fusarium piperis]